MERSKNTTNPPIGFQKIPSLDFCMKAFYTNSAVLVGFDLPLEKKLNQTQFETKNIMLV